MPSDRIYHYTSIESLALILKTRKLRFTRLDGVDDVREAQAHAGIDFGKFFFVSCWTQQAEESIPQWSMYSREMQGVRLELPVFPFTNDPLRPKQGWTGIEWQGDLLSPLPFEALWGPSYFITPMFLRREHFAGPVEYVPSVADAYARSIQREVHPDGRANLKIEALPLLPRRKSIEWHFQKEYRFSLFVLPSLPVPPMGPGSPQFFEMIGQHMSNSFINNVDPRIAFVDVDLSGEAFQDLVVRTGPLATAGGQASIEALVARFAPEARIEPSALSGAIRAKGR
jgi:hypothetical protein